MTARAYFVAAADQRLRTREFATADDLFAWVESDPDVAVLAATISDIDLSLTIHLGGRLSQDKPAPWWRQTYEEAVEQFR